MAQVAFPFKIRTDAGALVPGATVAVGTMKTLLTGVAVTPTTPTIVDMGNGAYSLVCDPSMTGDMDVSLTASKAGVAMTGENAAFSITVTREPDRILVSVPAAVPGTAGGLPTVNASNQVDVDLSQTIPVGASLDTIGRAYLGAISAAFGAETKSGTSVVVSDEQGHALHTFVLDSALTPSSRT